MIKQNKTHICYKDLTFTVKYRKPSHLLREIGHSEIYSLEFTVKTQEIFNCPMKISQGKKKPHKLI